ncbi:reverse transcriptase domain-containing protein [Tanacetum coccineum]
MTGVPRSITEHKLKIQQGYSPVRQKKRGQAPERAKAILEEVHKLVEAGIIAGPFPVAAGGLKFLIVAIDYFTKWIEAKAVATITGNQVKRFVWDNIVCRFGLPGEIVSDNGKQFCDNCRIDIP